MTRQEIQKKLLGIFSAQFEIENPNFDDNLREVHGFDSIDAIDLLTEIEIMLGIRLTRQQKKAALDIRTMNQIVDYVMLLISEPNKTA